MQYIEFLIETLEPVKMGSSEASENIEGALDYIAGSAIRGALIGKYIRKRQICLDACPDIKQKLLREVHFWNAYPYIEKQRTVPAPVHFLAEKKALSAYDGSAINIVSLFEQTPVGYKNCKKEPFVLLDSKMVRGIKVKKEFKLHVSVNGHDGNQQRAMFRYEAISEGQLFSAVIAVKEETLARELEELVRNDIVYLGGSKGSGYGKCRISYLSTKTVNPETEHLWGRPDENGNRLYVYYLSDAMLYAEDGTVSDHIDTNYLQKLFDVEKVSYCGGAMDTVAITGYNHTWRAVLPQSEGIRSGSVQCYEVSSMPALEKIVLLEEKGVGLRKTDGYGRIMVTGAPVQKQWKRIELSEETKEDKELSSEEKQELKMLLRDLYHNRILRKIDQKVVNTAEKIERNNLSNSQIGILQEMVSGYRYCSQDIAKEDMKQYFAHMDKRKRNKRINYQFDDARFGQKSIKEYILDFMEHCDDKDRFLQEEEFKLLPVMEQNGIRLSEDEVYCYNMIFLEKLMRYLLR